MYMDVTGLDIFFTEQENEWNRIREIVTHMDEHPLDILTELFKNGDTYFYDRLIRWTDKVTLLEMQNSLYQHLVPALKKYLSINNLEIFYKNEMNASLYFYIDTKLVGELSVTSRYFKEAGMDSFFETRDKIAKLEQLMEKNQQELEKWMLYLKKPYLLSAESYKELTKALFIPKKSKKDIKQHIMDIQDNFAYLVQEKNELTLKITQIKEAYVFTSYELDKIKRKLETLTTDIDWIGVDMT